ncbi:MAG: Gx transporter family protein [Rhodocyclaceae bacterium]|nr:Gx transporter family protein [Rhodocyclaceae bacterium]
MRQLTLTPDDHRIARLTAAAIAIALVESAVPSPLPGVKPGLANIITLLVLLRYDWVTAAWVTILRVFAVSLLVGQFLAPGFVLSLGGAIASLLVLYLALPLVRHLPAWFGPITLSLLAALAHMLTQLLIVRLWLVPSPGVWVLAPVFIGAALLFGTLNGLIVAWLRVPDAVQP